MNEGLQINLSMNGVQQALGSIGQLQSGLQSFGNKLTGLARINLAATLVGEASSIVNTLGGIQRSVFEFGQEFERVKREIGSNTFGSGLQAFTNALFNSSNRAEQAARRALDMHKADSDLQVDSAQRSASIELIRAQFAQKKITVEELFDSVRTSSDEQFLQAAKLLESKHTALQERLAKSNTDLEKLAITQEIHDNKVQQSMLVVTSSQEAQRLKAEQIEAIKKRDDDLLANQVRSEDRILKLKQDQFDIDRAMVSANFRLTDIEKRAKSLDLLKQERDIIKERVAALQTLHDAQDPTDTQGRELLQGRIDQTSRRGLDVGQQIAGIEGAPNPNSFRDQFTSVFTQLKDEWGTWATQMASSFKSVFDGAISSISSGISGLILGTQTWAQALANIGNQILTSIVGAIVNMGVRWIATQILMATVGKSIMAASLAANAGIATAQSAIWATPATLSTIASFGASAAAAPGLIASANAITLASSVLSAGFERGGYTGDGHPASIAGIVHRGEYVIPAPQVDRMGVHGIESMLAGGGGGGSQNIAFFDDGSRLADWARTQDGETVIVDVVRRNLHRFGQA